MRRKSDSVKGTRRDTLTQVLGCGIIYEVIPFGSSSEVKCQEYADSMHLIRGTRRDTKFNKRCKTQSVANEFVQS